MCAMQNNATPLKVAAEKDRLSVVKLLLESGADIDKPNNVSPAEKKTIA